MADLASQPTSVQTVYNWFRGSKLFVNRRYQRKLVWTQTEKQKLIESLLKKYPVPAILVAERDNAPGTYEIIDGLQRLHSIVSYIENAFPLSDGRYFNLEFFPTAKTASTEGLFQPNETGPFINAKDVSTILDYSLALSVMRNATDTEINDVFDRINTYGHRLSDQERRQSGVQNDFSNMIRDLACTLRGDSSELVLPLESMPSISIDLPMSNHGYEVKAEEVFWVNQGILRSTDLRDSLDEQCLADIAACIVGGTLIERSKDALDEIYTKDSTESERVITALELYGSTKLTSEIKYCIDEILKVCNSGAPIKLRRLLFLETNTNAFPAVFAVLLIAFHELIIKGNSIISDYPGVKNALQGLSNRIKTSRQSTSVDERRKNIDVIKGLIGSNFTASQNTKDEIYANHTIADIESSIRRSEIELANYELKQGILHLKEGGTLSKDVLSDIAKTICAIANIDAASSGKIILGISNKKADADRAKSIDGILPIKVGKRFVVGVTRESKRLKISAEQYFTIIRDSIRNSPLSTSLKDSILARIDFHDYYGLGIIVISIPPQKEVSYYRDDIYTRRGDQTEKVTAAKEIAAIASRFP